jgi:hypothetical protein
MSVGARDVGGESGVMKTFENEHTDLDPGLA